MLEIKVFGKNTCQVCKDAFKKYNLFIEKWNLQNKVNIQLYDMENIDDLVEGTMLGVIDVPTTIILDEKENIIARWDKKVALSQELKQYLEQEVEIK
ncbi:MAG: hypothetical protein ABIB46_06785 [bacterium]